MLSRAAGKENRNAVVRQEELDTYIDELTLELNEAYTHIHALKEQNGRLLRTVADHEQRLRRMEQMQEEIQFLKETERQTRRHVENYQMMNHKLRIQLLEQSSQQYSKQPQQSIQEKHQLSKEHSKYSSNAFSKSKPETTVQGSLLQTSNLVSSLHVSRSKPNHLTTPKSKVAVKDILQSSSSLQQGQVYI